jgi:hypothetical protein
MSTWNKRAVQGALIRLDQTGMIKRFRAHRKGTDDEWITCIQVLREPREEDLHNLKFRRQVNIDEPDEQLDEDIDGETLMRDLEVDMMNIDQSDANGSSEDAGRIPPQWIPDRMLSSILFEVVELGGSEGWDAGMLRDRVVGKFWRRPMESYVSRLTDDWEKTQPPHLRHLALIRDTRNTEEKKFIHYVYRTYKGFREAVEKGQAAWAGVTKPASKQSSAAKGKAKKKAPNSQPLDKWGFPVIDQRDFVGKTGSATLAEIRAAIVHGRKNGPRWDIALSEEIGYQKGETPLSAKSRTIRKAQHLTSKGSSKQQTPVNSEAETPNASDKENEIRSALADGATDDFVTTDPSTPTAEIQSFSKSAKQTGIVELTAVQRVALGLQTTGRLSKNVENQIREHRRRTGDPISIPDFIKPETPARQMASLAETTTDPASPETSPVGKPIKRTPLMTKEERIAAGLPARGRLGKEIENQIREQRGLSKLPEKQNKPRNQYPNEPPLLSKQQRIDLGINPSGRLPQGLMDGLREERHSNIPLEQSSVLKEYLDMLKAIKDGSIHPKTTFTPRARVKSTQPSQDHEVATPVATRTDDDACSTSPALVTIKRKAEGERPVQSSKRQRTLIDMLKSATHARHSTASSNQVEDTHASQIASPSKSPPDLTSMQVDAAPADRVQSDSTHNEKSRSDDELVQVQQDDTNDSSAQPSRFPRSRRHTISALAEETLPELEDANLSLETGGLDRKSQLIKDRYLNRSGPGLYIDPFAKRKIGRGRPRNSFIATVRSELLSDLSWFKIESEDVAEVPRDVSVQISDEDNNSLLVADADVADADVADADVADVDDADVDDAGVHDADADEDKMDVQSPEREQPPLQTATDGSASVILQDTADSAYRSVDVQMTSTPESTEPTAVIEPTKKQDTPEASVDDVDAPMSPAKVENKSSKVLTLETTAVTDQESETSAEQLHRIPESDDAEHTSPDPQSTPSWTMPTWTAINAPTRAASASYQSPYAPASQNEPTPTQQSEEADVADETPTHDAEESNIQGVYSVISEVNGDDDRTQKSVNPKVNKLGGGSWVTFRHAIIREIIDICKGVYPLHGEIGRPFTTLWERRHPNIKPPNSSTVLANLRDMIANPDNGLKKLTFLVKLRQGPSLKRREIVAYQHLTPSSPEVMRLAYNMANFPSAKSHQYYPEEIRHLVDDTSFYVPVPVAPKDETVNLDHLNPNIDSRIHEAQLKRRRKEYHDKKNEEKARKAQNALVERALAKKTATGDEHSQIKRMRLASLNDKKKRYRRAPFSKPDFDPADGDVNEQSIAQPTQTNPTKHAWLRWQQPWVGPDIFGRPNRMLLSKDQHPGQKRLATDVYPSWITAPIVRFYPTNGTFSTEFGLVRAVDLFRPRLVPQSTFPSMEQNRGTKRVRIGDAPTRIPAKRIRLSKQGKNRVRPQEHQIAYSSSEESDDSDISSSGEEDDQEDTSASQSTKPKTQRAKMHAKVKRHLNKKAFVPTLLDRLTGLTEDSNSAASDLRKHKRKPIRDLRTWRDRKTKPFNRHRREKLQIEVLEPVTKFKRFCCTLVVASSMAGDDAVDWSIVEKVLGGSEFDLSKTKKLWAWVQTKMPAKITELKAAFQHRFIEAYENGQVAAIDDPEAYDWAALVEWTARKCVFTEIPLSSCQEELQQYAVDESRHEALDRSRWYKDKIADSTRMQLQLQYSFTAPLHRPRSTERSPLDNLSKARSYIRANTATPFDKYDRDQAHEKLKNLGDSVLVSVVGEYVKQQVMKMRKSKRLLPGRNYDFTARFARKYGRLFELHDFMAAVKAKKTMDAAFADADHTKRVYPVARGEEDGSIMAVLSLVSEGKARLLPKLPPIDNELGAPLPRLSVWGFCEGDYVHRSIDRQRMFWDIHVVPTATYSFGSPLQPSQSPLLSEQPLEAVSWKPLPAPPLPGVQDTAALLPIWSTIDGHRITWPWWYRIMNMVLQPLIFQPGITAPDIHAHCPENTVELFEVELVLGWLRSVGAVKNTAGGGYMTMPGAWAAFGEKLFEMEDDWLNDHLQRKTKKHEKQRWREEYALQYSSMRQRAEEVEAHQSRNVSSTDQEILRNPSLQYTVLQQSQNTPEHGNQPSNSDTAATPADTDATPTGLQLQETGSQPPSTTDRDDQDVTMDI